MDDDSTSTDRRIGDYVLVAIAFVGFIIFLAGIILASPLVTGTGLLMMCLPISIFGLQSHATE